MHIAQELVAGLDKLVSLPSAYYRIRQALDDETSTSNSLAELISTDPSLSGTLLRMANSAYYGFQRRVETIPRAISLIGLQRLGDIVLGSAIATTFGGMRPQNMDMRRFWRSSVRSAMLCRMVAEAQQNIDPDRMFLLGLLSDMGHLVMYQAIPDLADLVLETAGGTLAAVAHREREIIGCDFAEVGAALASSWRLPVSIGAPIGAQLQPENAGEHTHAAAILKVVRHIDDMCESGESLDNTIASLPSDAMLLANINIGLVPGLIAACEAELNEMLHALGLAAN